MSRLVLGLNTDHGDSSAALVGERGTLAAIAEERINRKKHCADFPKEAIREVLRIAGADLRDVTDIAVARDPWANLGAKLRFLADHPGSGLRMARERLGVHRRVASTAQRLAEELGVETTAIRARSHQVEHHLAHVASAFYWSPFERAAAFTCDGAGDFATTMWAICEGTRIRVLERNYWPHSLGVFYTALTQFIGFEKYGEEYKVMGLSAYGRNRYGSLMRRLVSYDRAAGLRLDLRYYDHQNQDNTFESIEGGVVTLKPLWGRALEAKLGPARRSGGELTERERDLAASMQRRYEDVFLDMVNVLVERTGIRDVVLAGGCALNSVANGRMLTEGFADRAYFHPAAGDDGTAMGAALWVLHDEYGVPRQRTVNHSFWGTAWTDEQIEAEVTGKGRRFERLGREELIGRAAEALAGGQIVGWFQGREEWGPRALGNRSILCDPSRPEMKATLNARVKNREPFRPFAPVVREEDLSTVFEGTHPVPFMIVVYFVRPEWRTKLPAITHEDGTGRVQTVRREDNELYYDLLTAFKERTGVPVLLNTSFNENEPIVHTPREAIECFERTRMDALGIGSFWLTK